MRREIVTRVWGAWFDERYWQSLMIGEIGEGAYPWGESNARTGGRGTAERICYVQVHTNDAEEHPPEIDQSLDELAREGARRIVLATLWLEVEQ
jgi:hypothetical protein